MAAETPDAEKLQRVVASERDRLADDPNVVGVGMGPKIQDGEHVPGAALLYIVREKYDDEEAMAEAGTEALPSEVGGFVTDVRVSSPDVPDLPTGARGTRIEDPLVGGTSTTVLSEWHSFPTGYGTLGGICFDAGSGDAMAISNAHVWGEETDRDVIQPWQPVGEYVEAVVKLALCGPTVSYLAEWEWPSPLTAGLAAGAAAAAAAAAASDEEDPSRFGQRTTSPPDGARTDAEHVELEAELPDRPYPGLPYTLETTWDYRRFTDQGEFTSSTEETRRNEHVIRSKRVWTRRGKYDAGDRVEICAEILGSPGTGPDDYFVVAQCFPLDDRDRVQSRVLRPGRCPDPPAPGEYCFESFPERFYGDEQPPSFPLHVGPFRVDGPGEARFGTPPVGEGPQGLALGIPHSDSLRVDVTPIVDEMRVDVSHTAAPVRVRAFNQLGQVVDTADGGGEERRVDRLELSGRGISRLSVSGGGGEGWLHGLCVEPRGEDEEALQRQEPRKEKEPRFGYRGTLDVGLGEDPGPWGITLDVQTVDNSRRDADPVTAAQTLGGITASQNVADLGGCLLVLLLDHVFDVI